MDDLILKKNNNTKKTITIFLSIALIFVLLGVSYAFFGYYKEGLYTHTFNGGKMNVIYDEKTGNNIVLSNVYPLTDEEALNEAMEFEFSITGYNESEKNIYYAIEMQYGNGVDGKNRFKDSDFKISLYENEELVIKNEIFENLDEQGIFYNYIPFGTSENSPLITNYKLRLWVSDNVIISNTIEDDISLWDDDDFNWASNHLEYDQIYEIEEGNVIKLSELGLNIYQTTEFGNLYGSFKVNVMANLSGEDIGILVYDANGGENTPKSTSLLTNRLTMQKPLMDGMGFLGWSTKKDATVPEYYAGDYYNGPAKTLYAVYGNTKNVMGVFPEELLNYSYDITKVNFISEIQNNIDKYYNSAELKWDLTLDNQGSVKSWIDKTTLYVASSGTTYLTNCADMFRYWENLQDIDFSNVDTSMVTNMSYMFSEAYSLTTLDVLGFNTSNVTDMTGMFANKWYLNELNLSNFDTRNVTTMEGMFNCCSNLRFLEVSSFNTEKVENMSYMFGMQYRGAANFESLDLSHFNTSNVTTMEGMFANNGSLRELNISSFDTSKVVSMGSMFMYCNPTQIIDLNHFDTSNVLDMSTMFRGSNLTNFKISNFKTNNVIDMSFMFYSAYYNNGIFDLDFFDTSSVKNISSIFMYFSSDTLKFSNKDLKNIESASNVFKECGITNLYMENCHMSDVITVSFGEADAYELKYVSFKGCTNLRVSFYRVDDNLLEIDFTGCHFGGNGSITSIFAYCEKLEKVIFDNCDFGLNTEIGNLWGITGSNSIKYISFKNAVTTNITSMSKLFNNLYSLEYINLEGIDTSNVTDMSWMFHGCENFKQIDLSPLNTINVTNMSYMFARCTNLQELDFNNFDTGKVTDMSRMFLDCVALTSLDLSNFDTSLVTNIGRYSQDGMFGNCPSLIFLDISSFDFSTITYYTSAFQGMSDNVTIYVKDATAQTKILEISDSYRPSVWSTSNIIIKS